MSYTTHNINPKPYAYGCSIQIYWTTSANEYWNIFTKKKHIALTVDRNQQQQQQE